MFSKKKTECRVCGYRFTPERENIYTAEEPRSALEMQAFGMRFLRLGSGRSHTAAGVREGTRLDAMRRRLPAADY